MRVGERDIGLGQKLSYGFGHFYNDLCASMWSVWHTFEDTKQLFVFFFTQHSTFVKRIQVHLPDDIPRESDQSASGSGRISHAHRTGMNSIGN